MSDLSDEGEAAWAEALGEGRIDEDGNPTGTEAVLVSSKILREEYEDEVGGIGIAGMMIHPECRSEPELATVVTLYPISYFKNAGKCVRCGQDMRGAPTHE